MVTLMLEALAVSFVLAGGVVGVRSLLRRRRENVERRRRLLERRRLASLGTVDGHREYPR